MTKIQVLSTFLITLLWPLAGSAQVDLSVERAEWTSAVDRTTKSFGPIYKSPIAAIKKIVLWTQLRGSEELYNQLLAEKTGRIPIKHIWYRYDSDSVYADAESTTAVNLEIGRPEDLKSLAFEVAKEGSFSWRVWSSRDRLIRGTWRVDVTWENGDPLLCPASDGPLEPCRYYLEVH